MGLNVLSLLFQPELLGLYLKKALYYFISFVFYDYLFYVLEFSLRAFFFLRDSRHLHVTASGFGAGVRAVFLFIFFSG